MHFSLPLFFCKHSFSSAIHRHSVALFFLLFSNFICTHITHERNSFQCITIFDGILLQPALYHYTYSLCCCCCCSCHCCYSYWWLCRTLLLPLHKLCSMHTSTSFVQCSCIWLWFVELKSEHKVSFYHCSTVFPSIMRFYLAKLSFYIQLHSTRDKGPTLGKLCLWLYLWRGVCIQIFYHNIRDDWRIPVDYNLWICKCWRV